MEEFKADNCFYYILLHWLHKKSGVRIPEHFLYFVFGRIHFKYTSVPSDGNRKFPIIDLCQYSEEGELTKWLWIEKKMHEPRNAEMAWEEVKQQIEAGGIPIVRIMLHELPGYDIKDTLNTLLAIEEYFPENQEVSVQNMFYTGRLSIEQLNKSRLAIEKFGSPAYQWLELKYHKLPALNLDYFYFILKEKVRMGASLIKEQQQCFEQFAVDVENALNYGNLLKKIFLTTIKKELYHPIGPPAARREVLTILKELNEANFVSKEIVERYSELVSKWDNIKILVAKASVEPKGIIERLAQRIRSIAELEKEVMLHLQLEVKEEIVGESV